MPSFVVQLLQLSKAMFIIVGSDLKQAAEEH